MTSQSTVWRVSVSHRSIGMETNQKPVKAWKFVIRFPIIYFQYFFVCVNRAHSRRHNVLTGRAASVQRIDFRIALFPVHIVVRNDICKSRQSCVHIGYKLRQTFCTSAHCFYPSLFLPTLPFILSTSHTFSFSVPLSLYFHKYFLFSALLIIF